MNRKVMKFAETMQKEIDDNHVRVEETTARVTTQNALFAVTKLIKSVELKNRPQEISINQRLNTLQAKLNTLLDQVEN